jgi:hypothetical protein
MYPTEIMVPHPANASSIRQGVGFAGMLILACASGRDSAHRAECQPVCRSSSSSTAGAGAAALTAAASGSLQDTAPGAAESSTTTSSTLAVSARAAGPVILLCGVAVVSLRKRGTQPDRW